MLLREKSTLMPTQECVVWIIYLPCEEICLYAQFDTMAVSHEPA